MAESSGGTDTADPSTTGAPMSTTTGDASTSTPDESTGVADDSSGSSTTSVVVPEDCDPFLQDCPSGYKCAPIANDGGSSWNDNTCVPVVDDPAGIGEPCSAESTELDGLDTCGVGQYCWDLDTKTLEGECIGLCMGPFDDLTCEDPDAVCIVTGDSVFSPCLPGCDPLGDDCDEDEVCTAGSGNFLCSPDVSGEGGAEGEPCEFSTACDPGLACIEPTALACDDLEAAGCCLPYCSVSEDACSGGLTCVPWWQEGEAPKGQEDIGVCTEPQ